MSSADLSDIFSNIYGEESTQSFANVHIKNSHRPIGNVFYVNEARSKITGGITGGFTSERTLMRGGGSTNEITYSDPLGVANSGKFPNVKKFLEACYLDYLFVNAFADSIIVIPSSKEIEKMGDEVDELLKKEGAEKYSEKAKKILSTHEFSFKNYLLTMRDRSKADNDGLGYAITTYPSTDVIRRMSILGNIYYILPGSSIKVSATSDMKNSTTLSFVAKCARNVWVFAGDLPKASEKSKQANKVETLSGGSKNNYANKVNYFRKLLRQYNPDTAAYEFIGRVALTEKNNSKVAKCYSGDFISSAFEIMFDESIGSPLDMIYDSEEIDDAHADLVDAYEPRKSRVNTSKGREVFKQIFQDTRESAKTGLEANKQFINRVKNIYNKNGKDNAFKVDIASAIMKKGYSSRAFEEVIHVMDSVDKFEDNPDDIINDATLSSTDGKTTMLMQTIYNNLQSTPFISLVAKENVPLLSVRRKNKIPALPLTPPPAVVEEVDYIQMFVDED
ncbi:MAG: hypothetical protein WC939_05015 [Acholeplasmataceae bacterium]